MYLLVLLTDCIASYFGFDITNRVEHEHERIIAPEFIAIDIPMNCLVSIADGALLVYLLKKSPVEIKHPDSGRQPSHIAMIFAFAMYWIIGIASKGANIWNVITQFSPIGNSHACETAKCANEIKGIDLSLRIEQDLDSAATGMLLLFSIGYALFAIGYIRHRLPETHPSRKKLSLAIGILATAFAARNIVEFVITLFYSQFDHEASQGIQLLYLAFYGVLSVIVYTSVIFVEATQILDQPGSHEAMLNTGPLTHGYTGVWYHDKPQPNVNVHQYSHKRQAE